MLYYRYRSAVEKSSRHCLVTTFFVEFRSVAHGYHVYKRDWTSVAVLGEYVPYAHCSNIHRGLRLRRFDKPPIY